MPWGVFGFSSSWVSVTVERRFKRKSDRVVPSRQLSSLEGAEVGSIGTVGEGRDGGFTVGTVGVGIVGTEGEGGDGGFTVGTVGVAFLLDLLLLDLLLLLLLLSFEFFFPTEVYDSEAVVVGCPGIVGATAGAL